MNEHGPAHVAVLGVSHVDAENLADRIRHHLTTNDVIHGPALEGPGWAGSRAYQQGDRVLFHTRCGGRSSGIVNGTTATVRRTPGRLHRRQADQGRSGALSVTQRRQDERDAFTGREGWRDTEVTRLRGQLDAHCAQVAVSCARADDPLAYGVDVLRRGLAHHTRQLELLERRIPSRPQPPLAPRPPQPHRINDGDQARRDLADARHRLEAATNSRWRARPAEAAAARADSTPPSTASAPPHPLRPSSAPSSKRLAEHEQDRLCVINATTRERHDHAANRTLISDALNRTLDGRVRALTLDSPEHLHRALGPVPDRDVARAVWCHHASRLEDLIDHGEINPEDLRPLDRPRHTSTPPRTSNQKASSSPSTTTEDDGPSSLNGPLQTSSPATTGETLIWESTSAGEAPPSSAPDTLWGGGLGTPTTDHGRPTASQHADM